MITSLAAGGCYLLKLGDVARGNADSGKLHSLVFESPSLKSHRSIYLSVGKYCLDFQSKFSSAIICLLSRPFAWI